MGRPVPPITPRPRPSSIKEKAMSSSRFARLLGLLSVTRKTPFHPAAKAERRTITVGPLARTLTLYGGGAPYRASFIVLHGSRGSGEDLRRQSGHAFDRLAD